MQAATGVTHPDSSLEAFLCDGPDVRTVVDGRYYSSRPKSVVKLRLSE